MNANKKSNENKFLKALHDLPDDMPTPSTVKPKQPASLYEAGDFFRKGAQVRALSSQTLRLQLTKSKFEFDIPVDESISSVITGAFNLNPEKLVDSVVSGSGNKYYPALLAVNIQKHLVMRIESHPVNRPYGASIAFCDDKIIQKILMGIKLIGIDSGKLETPHAATEGDNEEAPAPKSATVFESPHYSFDSGMVMSKHHAEQSINLLVNIVANCRIAIAGLNAGTSVKDETSLINICGFIETLRKCYVDSQTKGATYFGHCTNKLDAHRVNINAAIHSPLQFRPISNMLGTVHEIVSTCSEMIDLIYPQFIPLIIKSHLFWRNVGLFIEQYKVAYDEFNKYIATASLAHWKAADTAINAAVEIEKQIGTLPDYAENLKIKYDSIESLVAHLKPRLDAADNQNKLALSKSGTNIGHEAQVLIGVAARLSCGKAANRPNLISEARQMHNDIMDNSVDMSARLLEHLPKVFDADNSKILDDKNLMFWATEVSEAYLKVAIQFGLNNLLEMPSPNYNKESNLFMITDIEENALNDLGWCLMYGAFSGAKTAKKYAAWIRNRCQAVISDVMSANMNPSKQYYMAILDINETCKQVLLDEAAPQLLFYKAIDFGLMNLPEITPKSVTADSTFGVVIQDLAYLYLLTAQGQVVDKSMIILTLQHVQASMTHKKHVMSPLSVKLRAILAEPDLATGDAKVQANIRDIAEKYFQYLITP